MKRYVLYGLETGSSDRLRTPSGKSTGKICLDRIYDGVTYLSCRANNVVHPWYKWRAHHQRYMYAGIWKIPFFLKSDYVALNPNTCLYYLCGICFFVLLFVGKMTWNSFSFYFYYYIKIFKFKANHINDRISYFLLCVVSTFLNIIKCTEYLRNSISIFPILFHSS